MGLDSVRALLFDVFGTVVDWRTSIIREGQALARGKGIPDVDWAKFADAWQALYQPSLQQVRSGRRPWTTLDVLHRESLTRVLGDFGITGLSEVEVDHLNRAWHRLEPWPDAVAGLRRLKRRFILATCSNGNVALLVNMAKAADLPWDAILGAEIARHYKPEPETYLASAALLDLPPAQCMMVAAHNRDLVAASALGFRTGFVYRRTEHGPNQTTDLRPEREWDVIAASLVELADRLDC